MLNEYLEEADEPEEQGADKPSMEEILQAGNVAEILSEARLTAIGDECQRGLKIDTDSRAEWFEQNGKAMELALQIAKAKNWPWPKASNFIYPLITVSAIQFAARAYPAIVPGREIVKGSVYGFDGGIKAKASDGEDALNPETGEPVYDVKPGEKRARADRIARHMSWQLLEEDEDWETDTDAMLHYLPIGGLAFRKRWVDTDKGIMRSKWLPATELVVNNAAPSLAEAPRVSEMVRLYPNEIRKRMNLGLWLEKDIASLRGYNDDDEHPNNEERLEDEQGIIDFYEQHCGIDLDDDEYPEPYIVTFAAATGIVVSIVRRFDQQNIIPKEKGGAAYIEPEVVYIKYDFLPNPKGEFYSLGFGWLLRNLNEGINTVINQMIDSGTLANMPSGFIGKGLRMKAGINRFKPGEFKPIDATGRTLAENIFQMRLSGPSPVLFTLLGLLIDASKDIASVSDIMTGSTDKNLAPGTAMILAEQGAKQFNAIFKRIHRSLKKELHLLFRQNSIYMNPQVYFDLLGTPEAVVKEDYDTDEIGVVPVSDPEMASTTLRMAKAQFLMQSMREGAALNPVKVAERALNAAGIPDFEELIQQPGPNPKNEIAKMKAETDRVRAMASADKALAEMEELRSRSIKNLAEAEGEIASAEQKELGQQIGAYFAHLKELREALNVLNNDQAGVGGLVGDTGNGNVQGVPAQNPQGA